MTNKKEITIILPEDPNPFTEAKSLQKTGLDIDTPIVLPANPKIEDVMQWVFKVSQRLSDCNLPAAWSAASANMLKAALIMKELAPPEIPDVKPRPRKVILIDEDE